MPVNPDRLDFLDPSSFRLHLLQEDVGRLQVPVDDPFAVRHVDGTGQRLDRARPPRPEARACRPAGSPGCRPRPTPGPGKAGLRSCRSRRPARCWGAAPAPPAPPPAGTAAPGRGTRTRPPAPSSGPPAGGGPGAAPCTPPPCPRARPRPGCRSPRPAWGRGESPARRPGLVLRRGRPGLLRPAQGANRRAALGRADQRLRPGWRRSCWSRASSAIVGGQLIDAAATRRTVAEVGGDVGQLRLGELAQGQRTQRFVARMVQRGLGHDKPVRVRRTAKRQRRFPVEKR